MNIFSWLRAAGSALVARRDRANDYENVVVRKGPPASHILQIVQYDLPTGFVSTNYLATKLSTAC